MIVSPGMDETEIAIGFSEAAGCSATVAGSTYRLTEDAEALDTVLKAVAAQRKRVVLLGDGETPYRCIGGAIYNLQRHGVEQVHFRTTDRAD